MFRGPTEVLAWRQDAFKEAAMGPANPGMPGRNLSLGITWVCDVGPAIRIGWVGLHEPSELKKKSVQFGAANAAEVLSAPDAQAIAPRKKQARRPAAALTSSILFTRGEVRGRRYTAQSTGAHDSAPARLVSEAGRFRWQPVVP
jgi:hypothetical protein